MLNTDYIFIPSIATTLLAIAISVIQPSLGLLAIGCALCSLWSLGHVLALLSLVEAHKTRESTLTHLASHDPLTGALNRAGFDEMVGNLVATRQTFGLVYVDLDGFKSVNDELGHAAGDQILVETARRLDQITRDTDLVARLGGDEFALLIPEADLEMTDTVCRRVLDLCEGFHVGDLPVTVSASVGAALYPHDGLSVRELVVHADQAMYEAKRSGKNRHVLWGTCAKNPVTNL